MVWQGNRGTAYGEGIATNRTGDFAQGGRNEFSRPSRSSTWQDDVYDRQPSMGVNRSYTARPNPSETFDQLERRQRSNSAFTGDDDYVYSDKPKPGRPTAPKPVFTSQRTGSLGPNQAIAKFTFDPDQSGDLGFKKGDVITIVKKTESTNDWWTGRIGDREGIFPR